MTFVRIMNKLYDTFLQTLKVTQWRNLLTYHYDTRVSFCNNILTGYISIVERTHSRKHRRTCTHAHIIRHLWNKKIILETEIA